MSHYKFLSPLGLLLLLLLFGNGCLERRIFVKWNSVRAPELYLHWSGDSIDLASGTLPGFTAPWILQPPTSGGKDQAGSFEQTGFWELNPQPDDNKSDTKNSEILLNEESPITPHFTFKNVYLGPVNLRIMNGIVKGNSLLPFSDPDSGAPVSESKALRDAGIPLTAESQDSMETKHALAIIEFRRIVLAKMLDRLSDSLALQHPKRTTDGISEWSDNLSRKWLATLHSEVLQANNIDFWGYTGDTLLPAVLSPDRMPRAYSIWKQLKRVHETYSDLEDENLLIDLQYGGWLLQSNADTTYGDTLGWKFGGQTLREGGPYSMRAVFILWNWLGATITLFAVVVLYILVTRIRRKRV